MNDEIRALQEKVETLYRCSARFAGTRPVSEPYLDQWDWDGWVLFFDLSGHPSAIACYAWRASLSATNQAGFYAVLKTAEINTPEKAVRAALLTDSRERIRNIGVEARKRLGL